MKVERVSYDAMTPSAARGLLDAVFWHPGLRWVVDRIHVCAPIRFTNIRRNEVKDTVSARKAQTVMEKGGELYLAAPDSIQQRAAMELRDVLILHYFQDLKLREIADILQIGLPLVKYRMRQAKACMRELLGEEEYP